MRRKFSLFKKALALVLAIGMALSLPQMSSGAQFSDTSGHWAGEIIEKWAQYNILSGFGDGTVRPNEPITVAQLATVINKVMKYKVTANTNFADVPQGSWYYEPLMALKGKGILNESGNMAYPDKILTREEAVVIIAKAFKVSTNISTPSFKDAGDISPESRMYVAAMQNYGYAVGSDGYFLPKESFTRAHVFTVINSIARNYMNEPKTYSNLAYGNALVNVPGAVLNRTTVNGDMYITPGVGSGDFTLETVLVKGRTIIQGGGPNSVTISNSKLEGRIIVDNDVSQVRLAAIGSSEINGDIEIYSDTILDGNFKNINVKGDNTTVIVNGEVDTIHISAANVTIIVQKDGSVNFIYADPGSEGSDIIGEGSVNTIYVNANNITIKIGNATIIVAQGINGTVIGTVTVAGGATYTSNFQGTDYIHSGTPSTPGGTYNDPPSTGGGSSTYIYVSGVTLNQSRMTLNVGNERQLTATIWPTNANNKNVTWSSSNSNIVSVENGFIRANATGTATITVRTAEGSHSATCYVEVVPGSIPAPETFDFDESEFVILSPTEIQFKIQSDLLNPSSFRARVYDSEGALISTGFTSLGGGFYTSHLGENLVGEELYSLVLTAPAYVTYRYEFEYKMPIRSIEVNSLTLSSNASIGYVTANVVPADTTEDKAVDWSWVPEELPEDIYISKFSENVLEVEMLKPISGVSIEVTATSVANPSISGSGTVKFTDLEMYAVKGRVVDSITVAPIPYAKVTLYTNETYEEYSGFTNTEGYYSINVVSGGYHGTVTADGYIMGWTQPFEVINSDITLSDVKLVIDDPEKPFYNIIIAESANGSVTTVPADEAKADTEVRVFATPHEEYEIGNITVTAAGGSIDVSDNTFMMPESDVTVRVEFVPDALKKARDAAQAAIDYLLKFIDNLTIENLDDAEAALAAAIAAVQAYLELGGDISDLERYDYISTLDYQIAKFASNNFVELTSDTTVFRGEVSTIGKFDGIFGITEPKLEAAGAYKAVAKFTLEKPLSNANITAVLDDPLNGGTTDGIQILANNGSTWVDLAQGGSVTQAISEAGEFPFYIVPNHVGTYTVTIQAKQGNGTIASSEYTVTVIAGVVTITGSISNMTFNNDVVIETDSDISVENVTFKGRVTIKGSGNVNFTGSTNATRRVNINTTGKVTTGISTDFARFYVNESASLDFSGTVGVVTVEEGVTVPSLRVAGIANPTVIGDGAVADVYIGGDASGTNSEPSVQTFMAGAYSVQGNVVGIFITTTVNRVTVATSTTSTLTTVGNITIGGTNTNTTVTVENGASVEQIFLTDNASAGIELGSGSTINTVTVTSASSTATSITGSGDVTIIQQTTTSTSVVVSETITTTIRYIMEILNGLSIVAKPNKTLYYVNDLLDLSGMVVMGIYNLQILEDGNLLPGVIDSYMRIVEDYETAPANGSKLNDVDEAKTITVSSEGKSSSFDVKVEKIPATLTFKSPGPKTVIYNGQEFDNPAKTNVDAPIAYSSSDPSVVTVDQDGKIKIVDVGKAFIWAEVTKTPEHTGAKTRYSVTVNVKELKITGIDVVYEPAEEPGKGTVTVSGGRLVGKVDGDNVELDAISAFAGLDKSIESNEAHPIIVAGYKLTGTDMGKYVLAHPMDLTVDSTKIKAKKTPVVDILPTPSRNLIYGESLGEITLSGGSMKDPETGAVVAGRFEWTNGDSLPKVGTIAAQWIFTPSNVAGYNKSEGTVDVTVSPREITVIGAKVEKSRIYDGSTNASISSIGELDGVLEADIPYVNLIVGVADYADAVVGIGKIVTFSEYSLSGTEADNYKLLQPVNVTSDITPKTVMVDGIAVKDKTYDGTDTAVRSEESVPYLTGVVGDDNVSLVVGTVKFAKSEAGSNRAIVLTDFDLAGADAKNYSIELPSVTANIKKAELNVVTPPTASPINAGQKLEESILTGGLVTGVGGETVTGSWIWASGVIIPDQSDFYEALFLLDNGNYKSTSEEVWVVVGPAVNVTGVTIATESGSGIYAIGETLKATLTTDAAGGTPSVTYKWVRVNSDGTVEGEVGSGESTYPLTVDDAGKYIHVEITAEPGTIIADGKDKSTVAYVNTDNDYYKFAGGYSVTCNRIGGLTFVVVAYEGASPANVTVNSVVAKRQGTTNEWRTVIAGEINAYQAAVVNQ